MLTAANPIPNIAGSVYDTDIVQTAFQVSICISLLLLGMAISWIFGSDSYKTPFEKIRIFLGLRILEISADCEFSDCRF